MISNQIVKMIKLIEKQSNCYININDCLSKQGRINNAGFEECTDLVQINSDEFKRIKMHQKEIVLLKEQIVKELHLKKFSIDQLTLYVNDEIVELLRNKLTNLFNLINMTQKNQLLFINKIKDLKEDAKNKFFKIKTESKLFNTYNNAKKIDPIFVDKICK